MHTVIETPNYLSRLKQAGVSEAERVGIVDMLAAEPMAGALIVGTGGARKVRYAKEGAGKSGGYRVISFFAAPDVPVFLLDIYGKGQQASISKTDKNELARVLSKIAAAYRQSSLSAAKRKKTKTMTAAGRRLLQAANEALAIAEGTLDVKTYEVHAPPAIVDVKAIRRSMNMTQVAFGERFGFGKARVRDWEQNRTRPTASDRVLLTTIKLAPDAVLNALAAEAATMAPSAPMNASPLRKPVPKRKPPSGASP